MKTPKDFDYDLWTTKENLCMVRIKATGEECEVSRETFRLLRAEEDRLKRGRTRRSKEIFLEEKSSAVLSVDIEPEGKEGVSSAWLMDTYDFVEEIITHQTFWQFFSSLTKRQQDVCRLCILAGVKKSDYAKDQGISPASVTKTVHQIQTKAKKFFGQG